VDIPDRTEADTAGLSGSARPGQPKENGMKGKEGSSGQTTEQEVNRHAGASLLVPDGVRRLPIAF
jgi:hypothetical protein